MLLLGNLDPFFQVESIAERTLNDLSKLLSVGGKFLSLSLQWKNCLIFSKWFIDIIGITSTF